METKINICPINMFQGIKKFLFLLIIPLIRGGIYYIVNGNFYFWLKGSWIDISTILTILVLSIARYNNYTILVNDYYISLKQGIVKRKQINIPKKKIYYITAEIPFYYRIINVIRLKCYILCKNEKYSNIKIIVTKSNFYKLKPLIFNNIDIQKNNFKNISFTKTIQTALLSLTMSNSLAGIVLISTFISTSSKILGYHLETDLYGPFTVITKKLAFGFSPAGAAITYILLAGWFVAFIKNLILYINFNLKKINNKLITSIGLLNNKIEYIDIEQINYIDVVQNIFTKTINLSSVFINICNNKKLITIIPSISTHLLTFSIDNIFNIDNFNKCSNKLTPHKISFFSYIIFPILFFASTFFACYKLIITYPQWAEFLYFIILINGIICFWLLIIKLVDSQTSSVSFKENTCYIRYSRMFKFHNVIIPKNKISKIVLKQTFMQKIFKNCNIYIYSFSTKPTKHFCKNINITAAKQLLHTI